jgi:cytoskeletal protein CcmA (bactofilin family)
MWEESQDTSSTPPSPGEKSESPASRDYSGNGSTRLSKSIKLKGEISGSGDLYIDGEVEGKIELQGNRVTVGPQGRVQADVAARNLAVLGRLEGKVCVAEKTDIRATGVVEGDLATARISIQYGAVLHATIDVVKPEQHLKDSNPISAAKRQAAPPSSSSEAASDCEVPTELQLTAS